MNGLSSNQNGTSVLRLAQSGNRIGLARPENGEAAEGTAESGLLAKVNSMALLHAAREGDLNEVNALLAKGADVNAKDSAEWTPLMLATVKGYLEVARALLNAGADVHAKNNKGWTALRFAVSLDDTEALRLILDGGADVNDKDNEGNTALMQAAHENSLESLKLLLAHGADTGIRNHSGETALKIAAHDGYPEILQWLNETGAGSEVNYNVDTDEAGLFSEGELQQLMEKIEGLIPLATPSGTSEEQALAPTTSAHGVLNRLMAALEAMRSGTQAAPLVSITDMAHKLMLNLPEATALSGLSRKHLRQAIKEGNLKSQKLGGRCLIKRADLEAYVAKL